MWLGWWLMVDGGWLWMTVDGGGGCCFQVLCLCSVMLEVVGGWWLVGWWLVEVDVGGGWQLMVGGGWLWMTVDGGGGCYLQVLCLL